MCRKFRFIADIDNKTVKDFVDYLGRVRKLYIIFGILAAVNLLTEFDVADHIYRFMLVAGVVLYFVISGQFIVCWLIILQKLDGYMLRLELFV